VVNRRKAWQAALAALLAVSTLAGSAQAEVTDKKLATQQSATSTTLYRKELDAALAVMHQEMAKQKFRYVLNWPALALYAAGESVTSPKWSTADGQNGVTWRAEDVRRNVGLSDATTDFESTMLGILAAGENPRAFGKKDFVQAVIDSQLPNGKFADSIIGHGEDLLNAHMFGILSLYAAGVEIPNKERALEYLVSRQHPDGGFHWSNQEQTSDVDSTAMALLALKALGQRAEDLPVAKALEYLKKVQTESGGFVSNGVENADSVAAVIEALLAFQIWPGDWKKGSGDPISHLLSFQREDGTFLYQKGGLPSVMSTMNAVMAIADLRHGGSVYDRLHAENQVRSGAFASGFPDLTTEHPYYRENIKLVNLGVMAGNTDGTYGPDQPVTREQFAKILVFGAGMQEEAVERTDRFHDLPRDGWANPYVYLAWKHKFIYGTSETTFDPTGHVNGGQLMAILVRMLGMEEAARAKPGQKSWQDGYVEVAREQGLWYPNFDPNRLATRAEVGYAFVRFYEAQLKMAK
jgi:hypothetical protein